MKNNTLSANDKKRVIVIVVIFLGIFAYIINLLSFRNSDEYKIEKKVSSIVDQRKYSVNLNSYDDVSFMHIEYHFFAYGKQNDLDDLNTALDVASMLKAEYPDRVFTTQVGARGSSQPMVYVYENDLLMLNFICNKSVDLLSLMEEHNIHGLILDHQYYETMFDNQSDDNLEKLSISTIYTVENASFETLTNLHRLEYLKIIYRKNDIYRDISDLTSLSRMDNLKTLVIYGDLSMIELPTTSCERITTVEIHDESDLDNNEQLERLKTIFPNAKITLEKDDR